MFTFLIVSDNKLLQDNIKAFMDYKRELYAFTSSCSFEEIKKSFDYITPQFIFIDFLTGFEEKRTLSGKLKHYFPDLKIIAIADSTDRKKIIDTFRSGIDAYLSRDGIFNELFRCVFTLMQGDKYLSSEVLNDFLGYLIDTPQFDEQRPGFITPREREHIACIAEGMNSKEIAYRLKISKKTVDNYRNRIMLKLKLNSLAEIVKYAIKEQIITL
ncbi:MAG: DNA-binding response regulator [Calditrichaeota bacterium]|nr:response regulator transcription factor [Spirochaetales bacterium]RQV98531.1 MAG: DNA-binding response regulator [Calditrichota bacterium]